MTKEKLKAEVKNSRPEHVAKSTWSAFVEKVIDRAWPHIEAALNAEAQVLKRYQDNAMQVQRERDSKVCDGLAKELNALIMPELDDRVIEVMQALVSKVEDAAAAIRKGDK